MSDIVIVAVISSISSTLAAVLSFMGMRLTRRVERQTNSMKDALVKVTGEAEFAKGLKEGNEGPGTTEGRSTK